MSKITIKLTKLLTISILSIFTVFGINTNNVFANSPIKTEIIGYYTDGLPFIGGTTTIDFPGFKLKQIKTIPIDNGNYHGEITYINMGNHDEVQINSQTNIDYLNCSEFPKTFKNNVSFINLESQEEVIKEVITILDVGQCQWERQIDSIPGCTNPNSLNYNSEATEDDGSCIATILGCTDSLATNYNPQANVHEEQSCIYPPDSINITGYIENTQVQSGSTTWNIKLYTNIDNPIIDISKIQTWNQFTPISSTTDNKIITITIRQFNDQRLSVECTNYEITVPKYALTTINGDTNENSITGNFTVVGCNSNNTNQDTQNQDGENQNPDKENKATNINNAELDENKTYLPIISQKDGVFYIDIKAVAFLILFILITFSFSYVIYKLFTKKY